MKSLITIFTLIFLFVGSYSLKGQEQTKFEKELEIKIDLLSKLVVQDSALRERYVRNLEDKLVQISFQRDSLLLSNKLLKNELLLTENKLYKVLTEKQNQENQLKEEHKKLLKQVEMMIQDTIIIPTNFEKEKLGTIELKKDVETWNSDTIEVVDSIVNKELLREENIFKKSEEINEIKPRVLNSGFYIVLFSSKNQQFNTKELLDVSLGKKSLPVKVVYNETSKWFYVVVDNAFGSSEVVNTIKKIRNAGFSQSWYIHSNALSVPSK